PPPPPATATPPRAPTPRPGSVAPAPDAGSPPGLDVSRVFSEAEVFVKYGLYERAVEHLRRIVAQAPEHAEARERLASVLALVGRSGEAAAELAAIGPTPPPAAATPPPDEVPEDLVAELEQIDFFVEQELHDEARSALHELARRFGEHPLVVAKSKQLGDTAVAAPPPEAGAVPRDEASLRGESGPDPATPLAVMAHGDTADLSTHGDLGIAYKEMGLFEAAIAEFRLLQGDPQRKVFALTMIGECLEAQGAFPDAVVRYKEALNESDVAEAESTQLYYLLGGAFERMGDRQEALYFFEKVAKRSGAFRDVVQRIAALKPTTDRPPLERRS
ncbi:MAG TPA: tetratricopeptide repeat protein, partial [Polyangia bacterium]|nr:tetratricopeptide repeat protein [Polyangia bacterium]